MTRSRALLAAHALGALGSVLEAIGFGCRFLADAIRAELDVDSKQQAEAAPPVAPAESAEADVLGLEALLRAHGDIAAYLACRSDGSVEVHEIGRLCFACGAVLPEGRERHCAVCLPLATN